MTRRFWLDPTQGIVLTALGLVACSLWLPGDLIRSVAAKVGADSLVWAGVLLIALSQIARYGSAAARRARRHSERLRRDEDLAQAMAVSYYGQESLDGALALTAMGRRVEAERQAMLASSNRFALIAAVLACVAAGAAVLAFEEPRMAAGAIRTLSASSAAAAILLAFARSIRRTAGRLEPSPEQIRDAVIRHHERQEAQLREHDSGLSALAAALTGRAGPAKAA